MFGIYHIHPKEGSMYSFNKKIFVFTLIFIFLACAGQISAQTKKKDSSTDPMDSLSLSALKFRGIGPALTLGRISDFAVNPRNHSQYFVATSSGGVGKTLNAGTTFTPASQNQTTAVRSQW
jgi:hypothetical protein